jgi:hypothetical protein
MIGWLIMWIYWSSNNSAAMALVIFAGRGRLRRFNDSNGMLYIVICSIPQEHNKIKYSGSLSNSIQGQSKRPNDSLDIKGNAGNDVTVRNVISFVFTNAIQKQIRLRVV